MPRPLGVDRATLAALGFDGKVGQTLVVPRQGHRGARRRRRRRRRRSTPTALRDAAAAFARAVPKHAALATSLARRRRRRRRRGGAGRRRGRAPRPLPLRRAEVATATAPAAVADAARPGRPSSARSSAGVAARRDHGRRRDARPRPRQLAAQPPHGHAASPSSATEVGEARAGRSRCSIAERLRELGCGGLLGVNAGSAEPPRMIKLTYRPKRRRRPAGHLALVGKGIMYDSGGISLKPSDPMHAAMKMDMSGAAAVLAAMSALRGARLPQRGDRLPDVHRQHAVGLGDEARRRAAHPRRQDRRDPQHRRRGPSRARRRARARRRGAARRHRRHRHADRRRAWSPSAPATPACSATTRRSSTRCVAPSEATDEPIVAAAAGDEALPQAARLRRRRHQERRRPVRRGDHRRRVPHRVRRRHAVGAPRHRRRR